MLTISKPLSAGQVLRYHAEEFRSARENYYTEGSEIRGDWHGDLAASWGLTGAVREDHFERLAEGQHPTTGADLVRRRASRVIATEHGGESRTLEHRAGWDATFSAPKSVSLTALVGGDDRVRAAHRTSVSVALHELEHYVQARIGNNHPAETTGRWLAARFEHDSARPVDGYAAPQLHTHVVVFNVTETAAGETRALQPRELYRTQQYATAVYRSELALRLQDLGYEIERGASGQPEIRGYTNDYLDASSPRRQQIQDYLREEGQRGAAAAQIAAHQTREDKLDCTHEEMQRRHQDLAAAFGHQPRRVVESAEQRPAEAYERESSVRTQAAITFAVDRNFEREAVVDERDLLRDALRRSMGEASLEDIRNEFQHRIDTGRLTAVDQRPGAVGPAFTTPEMLALEKETIALVIDRQHRHAPLAAAVARENIARDYPHLNQDQIAAVERVLSNRDEVMALEGTAGAGKTTTLAAIRDAAEGEGFVVRGFAPTSRAAQQLQTAGIDASTLQRHLVRGSAAAEEGPHLYVLDESSLASTRQMHEFLKRLGTEDRVLLVGDARQHQAVEAGRPYQQLQEAGLATARLDAIVRQQDPALKQVVEHLAKGNVIEAVSQLDRQGRIHQIADRAERFNAIAEEFLRAPNQTLVVSPDNRSRMELNDVIHAARRAAGQVDRAEQAVDVLVPRQDVTGADRQWAERYGRGDVIRYTTGSKVIGLDAGEYARVTAIDPKTNRLTVTRESGEQVTYDPRRLHGVAVYSESERAFSVGDRVQLTAPDSTRRLANRDLGTIESMEGKRQLSLRLDSGRTVTFDANGRLHLDYGYAVTSHSSQGQTADRVLVHVDTDRAGEALVNRRLAYVAISRGRYEAQIYTNDATQLGPALQRDVSHRSALEFPLELAQTATHSTSAPGGGLSQTPIRRSHDLGSHHEVGVER